jgi:serine/threonine protein kinase
VSENTPIPEPEAPQPSAAFGSVDPQSVEGLFLAALAKTDTDQRRTFLDQSCRDADQRQRVEALLRAYDDAGSFLETPVLGNRVAAGGSRESARDGVPLDFLTPTTEPGYVGALGPYLILEVIGRGGMGIVLRGFDRKLNRIVAIKVLAPELAANPNARRRFVREARAAASVSHPHVVTIHAVDDEQLPPYLVMECVVGQSLQEKLDRTGPLRLTEVLRIGRQVADGLAAAHQQGLVHRDIKPANILLENGVERVKITDFGLARAVDDVAITRAGEVSGTPQYMSPEQARGEPVDRRSDLFSLGCVLYAMCTGGPPFRGDSLAAVIKRVTEEHPQPIGEMNPEVPPWLADVISRLLEKDPARRFQSASEVAEVLAGRLASVQQPAGPAPLPERQPPPPKRRLSLFVARMAG